MIDQHTEAGIAIAVGQYVRLADGSSGLVSAVGPHHVRVILRRDPFDDAPLPPYEVPHADIVGPWSLGEEAPDA